MSQLQSELKTLNFGVHSVGKVEVRKVSRANLEKALAELQKEDPHILLALFPNEQDNDEDEWGSYHHFKSLTVGQGLPSQVVYRSTLDKQYAMTNIVLGILGKIGNIPFILSELLPYTDLVVGIDIARKRKERLAGSINATTMARICFNSGEFLRYVIHNVPLEGETIPNNILQSLFPSNEFTGKRVVIHRDGHFRGDEKQALRSWAQQIGATFYFVEVIKTGTPRLYATQTRKVQRPSKGDAFKLSETEAFLVSSLPPSADATP